MVYLLLYEADHIDNPSVSPSEVPKTQKQRLLYFHAPSFHVSVIRHGTGSCTLHMLPARERHLFKLNFAVIQQTA